VQGFCPTDFITSSYGAFIDQKRPAKGVSSAHSFLQILVHENLLSICIFGYQVTGGCFSWLLFLDILCSCSIVNTLTITIPFYVW
jgi:hypothetical protein